MSVRIASRRTPHSLDSSITGVLKPKDDKQMDRKRRTDTAFGGVFKQREDKMCNSLHYYSLNTTRQRGKRLNIRQIQIFIH